MAFKDWIGGRNYYSPQSELYVAPLQKDFNYDAELPQNQYQYSGEFVIAPVASKWTVRQDYEAKCELLLETCPISKACIEQRVNAIANIVLKVEGNRAVKRMLALPNHGDKTMSAALGSWEQELSVGGIIYLFYNFDLTDRPTVQALRPDLVGNNTKLKRFEYHPGGLSGKTVPLYSFDYDANGATTAAWEHTSATKKQPIQAALQRIAKHNPRNSGDGLAPGDAALKSVDNWLAAQDLIHRKFKSGGTMAGFLKMPGWKLTNAEAAAMRTQIAQLQPNGGQNLLANGMDFQAAQMSFADLDLVKLQQTAAEEICAAFAVSAETINVGSATHANQRASDKMFYRNFAGPEAHWLIGQLEWGVRKYIDPNASVTVDETAIQHLEEDLDDKLTKWAQSGVVTIDECRAIVGLDPLPDGEGKKLTQGKSPSDDSTGLGQPETKPGGETAFNANAGNRGDNNNGQ